jgi:DNA-binding transcriptional ArsR family regulator
MLAQQWLGYRRSMAAPAYDSDIAPVAALLADQARAAMLMALLPGRPLAAGELAEVAHVSAPTASAHLAKLLDGGLLTVTRQGRHRYYGLASYQIAEVIEQIALIGRDIPVRSLRQSKQAQALAAARTCYDHLAGLAGVELMDALLRTSVLKDTGQPLAHPWPEALSSPGRMVLEVTPGGEETLASFGIKVDELRHGRRRLAGACLDWTERRAHLSGALGAAITARLFELDWIERGPRARSINLTTDGRSGLTATFGWTG